ncbi:MAG: hypothetical protein ABI947_15485 [Chloroflexota bacterium]
MRRKNIVLMIILALVLAACAGSQEFNIVDLQEKLGKVFKETTGDIDNSKGTEDLATNVNAKKGFRHTINLTLNSNSQLDEKQVKDRILEFYDLSDSSGEKSCVIPAEVPANHIYAYNIEWTQVIRQGNIQQGKVQGQGDTLGTYDVVIDLQCQVVGVEVRK